MFIRSGVYARLGYNDGIIPPKILTFRLQANSCGNSLVKITLLTENQTDAFVHFFPRSCYDSAASNHITDGI